MVLISYWTSRWQNIDCFIIIDYFILYRHCYWILILFSFSDAEMRRLCCNWTVFVIGNTFGISYFIVIPSLHQFVTSTTHPSNPNVSTCVVALQISEDYSTWFICLLKMHRQYGRFDCFKKFDCVQNTIICKFHVEM